MAGRRAEGMRRTMGKGHWRTHTAGGLRNGFLGIRRGSASGTYAHPACDGGSGKSVAGRKEFIDKAGEDSAAVSRATENGFVTQGGVEGRCRDVPGIPSRERKCVREKELFGNFMPAHHFSTAGWKDADFVCRQISRFDL